MEVVSVSVGKPRVVTISGEEVSTGIFKEPASGRVMVRRLNLEGDAQGDLRVHGGENMAVYAYPVEHYPFWENELGRADLPHGQFGENLTVRGLTEERARVGEVYRIGGALLQVTQPRVTCFKLPYRMGAGPEFAKRFLESRRMGFYFRVLQEGEVGAGDAIELIESAEESVTIAEFIEFTQFQTHDPVGLRRVLASRDLSTGSKGWREQLEMMAEKVEGVSAARDWEGFCPFVVDRKVPESDTVTSFYLVPEDGEALPGFQPGQFLTFKLYIEGQPRPVIRTYSISDSPSHKDYYRVSIKREAAPEPGLPAGISSTHFHDQVEVGTRLWVKAPRGEFYLDPGADTPVVLLSGGVGLTPMISMLNAIVESGSQRPTWFVHGARDGRVHAMGAHVRHLATENDNVRVHISYSQPGEEDMPGRDYENRGQIDVELLERILPGRDFEFYLCGPPPFMKSLFNGLLAWGVPESRIRYEFFGPATALKPEEEGRAATRTAEVTGAIQVSFARSGVIASWDPSSESLLDLAEAQGLSPDFSCRSGICQSCICKLLDGEVEYFQEPLDVPDPGCVLICSAIPKTDVVVDV